MKFNKGKEYGEEMFVMVAEKYCMVKRMAETQKKFINLHRNDCAFVFDIFYKYRLSSVCC